MKSNIQLKPFEYSSELVEKYLEWFNSDDLQRYLEEATPRTFENISTWIKERCVKDSYSYKSVLLSGENIGHVGLKNIDTKRSSAELAIILGNSTHRNRGLGTYTLEIALNDCRQEGFKIIKALIKKDNKRSKAVFKKNGFKKYYSRGNWEYFKIEFLP